MLELNNTNILEDVKRALVEDLSADAYKQDINLPSILDNDVTANLIDSSTMVKAKIITREDMVLCGSKWAHTAFTLLDPNVVLTWQFNDADKIKANDIIAYIEGSARSILIAERTALNFLQFLSATASVTAQYTKHLEHSHTKLLDTRKTIPGFRAAQKYAVTCGGGYNHRIGLFDAFLIKENHIKACGSIARAIGQARATHQDKKIEVEVESLNELKQAIDAKSDIIMLDNFSLEQIYEAVSINNQQCKLEVSGNITEERLRELAKTGVDYVSSGAITKHVKAIDLSLLIL